MKNITSRDNPFFKSLLKLSESASERKKQELTIIDGIHLVKDYYEKFGLLKSIVVSDKGIKHPEVQDLISLHKSAELVMMSDVLFKEVSSLITPIGILAVVPIPDNKIFQKENGFCLACEDIQDPGNLGTILRSASAAGVEDVLLSPKCVSAWAPKVLRSSQGAHFLMNVHESIDLINACQNFKGKVIATSPGADLSVFEVDMKGSVMLLIGNEGNGLSLDLMQCATHKIRIPMPGKIESLNASVAAAICLFERVRQTNNL